jgi:hypothetical protein
MVEVRSKWLVISEVERDRINIKRRKCSRKQDQAKVKIDALFESSKILKVEIFNLGMKRFGLKFVEK